MTVSAASPWPRRQEGVFELEMVLVYYYINVNVNT